MKKCARCGKHHENEFLTFCHDCAKNIEKELEEVLPKSEVKELKKRPLFYLLLNLSLTVLVLLFFSGLLFLFYNTKVDRDNIATLNLDLNKKANELNALQESLSKSEEGLQQIAEAKAKVEAQNQELDKKASSSDQILAEVKKQLSDTQNKLIYTNHILEIKTTQLDRLNQDIGHKQLLSDKEARFAVKFAEVQELLPIFIEKTELVIQYLYELDYQSANTALNSSIFYYDQISQILSDLESDKY